MGRSGGLGRGAGGVALPRDPLGDPERALEILRGQAWRGLLDADLLEVFIAGRIYEKAGSAPR
jgi:hypothetical protein